MNKDLFSRAVEADLEAREVSFDRTDLWHFLAAVWDLVHPRDTPRLWADAFRKVTAQRAPASGAGGVTGGPGGGARLRRRVPTPGERLLAPV